MALELIRAERSGSPSWLSKKETGNSSLNVADSTIALNGAGNAQMKINLFESADLNTFAPLTLNPDSVSVVDGSICLEFAPEDRAAFFRFNVE